MDVSDQVQAFWKRFVAVVGDNASARFYEAFHFDDNERDANALAQIVLTGRKRATAGLLWSFEATNRPVPKTGDLSVVTSWDGQPLCIIETTGVEILPYEDVSEAFAAREGEGDFSLRHWREVHWLYFSRECQRIGSEPDLQMPVVCESFEVVFRET